MPATKKKTKNPPKADQSKTGKQGGISAKSGSAFGGSQEMMNAMMLLFAGGMIVLAYVLYLSYV